MALLGCSNVSTCETSLKQRLKRPDSYERLRYSEDASVTVIWFRAENSLGDYVPDRAVCTVSDGKPSITTDRELTDAADLMMSD